MNSYPDYKRGRPLPLADLQRVDLAATAALRGEIGHDAGPGAIEDTDPQGRTLNLWGRPRVWAKVTGASTSGPGGLACYPWEECLYDDSAWVAVGGGRSGTGADNPIKESNDNVGVPSGAVVIAELHDSGLYWLFNYEPGTGGGGSTITVEQGPSGTPEYTNTDTIRFTPGDNTTVTVEQLSAGLVEVRIAASGVTIVIGGDTYYNLPYITFPPPYYRPGPGGVPYPTIKYETWFRNVLAGTTGAGWFFGGEPNLASNVTLSTGQPAQNKFFALPYLSARPAAVDSLAFWCAGLATGGKVRLGIYTNTSDEFLYPDRLVVDSGEFNCDLVGGTTGLRVAAINVNLEGNTLYWLCFLNTQDGSPIGIKAVHLNECWSPMGQDDDWTTTDAGCGWISDQTYGALPATFPSVNVTKLLGIAGVAGIAPAVALRYASPTRIIKGGGRGGAGAAVMGGGERTAFTGRVVRGNHSAVGVAV